MKRVTLTKLHDPQKLIVSIKCLRTAACDPKTGINPMGLKEAKQTVNALAAGSQPTVQINTPEVLRDCFEFTVEPSIEHFYATHRGSTALVIDNYPVGADGFGSELFIQVAHGDDISVTPGGFLDTNSGCQSGVLSREQAERLYEFVGDWLGK